MMPSCQLCTPGNAAFEIEAQKRPVLGNHVGSTYLKGSSLALYIGVDRKNTSERTRRSFKHLQILSMISRFLRAIVWSQGNVLIFDEAHNLLEVRRNATILLQTVKGRGSFDTAQANTHLYNTCSVSMLRCDFFLMGCDSTPAPKYRELLHKFGW